jgi:hypothetical protein
MPTRVARLPLSASKIPGRCSPPKLNGSSCYRPAPMHKHVPALVLLLALSVPTFAADQVIIPHQCSKFGGTMKTGRHRSRHFLKNSVKIGENQENSAETHRRCGGTLKPGTPINQPVWLINRPIFQKTGVAISGRFLLENGCFLSKIGKWN